MGLRAVKTEQQQSLTNGKFVFNPTLRLIRTEVYFLAFMKSYQYNTNTISFMNNLSPLAKVL